MACASRPDVSEASSACWIAASCLRRAEICWLRMSTWASALAEICRCASSALAAALALSRAASAPAPPAAAASSSFWRSFCEASSVADSEAILVWSSPFCDRSSASRLVSSSICWLSRRQRRVLARHLARQEELRQHEHRQQEDDDQQHRRQRVDEAGPIVHALEAPPLRQRHGLLRAASRQCVSRSLVRRRSSLRMSSCWAVWALTQSRICCCSCRMWLTSDWMPSARLAIAAALRRWS